MFLEFVGSLKVGKEESRWLILAPIDYIFDFSPLSLVSFIFLSSLLTGCSNKLQLVASHRTSNREEGSTLRKRDSKSWEESGLSFCAENQFIYLIFKINDLEDPTGGGLTLENRACVEKGRPLSSIPITSKREFSVQARKMGEDSTLQIFAKRALRACLVTREESSLQRIPWCLRIRHSSIRIYGWEDSLHPTSTMISSCPCLVRMSQSMKNKQKKARTIQSKHFLFYLVRIVCTLQHFP